MIISTVKRIINNIRGVEMALSTVITIVLLLIVLIIAATFFLGGSEVTLKPMMGIGEEAAGHAEKAEHLEWLK